MIAAALEWYVKQEVPLQAALLSALTTLLVLFLGVWLNALANRRNTLKASRDAQKLEIYKILLEKIEAASAAQIAADGYLRAAEMSISIHSDMAAQGLHATPPKHRFPEFSRLHQEQHARLSEVHRLLEQWAIIDPRLRAFRMAFGYQSNASMIAAMSLNEKLMRLLPTENPQGGLAGTRSPPCRAERPRGTIPSRERTNRHLSF